MGAGGLGGHPPVALGVAAEGVSPLAASMEGQARGKTLGIRNPGVRGRNKKPYSPLLLSYILVGEMKIEVIGLSHNKIKRKFVRPKWNLAQTVRSLKG